MGRYSAVYIDFCKVSKGVFQLTYLYGMVFSKVAKKDRKRIETWSSF